MPNSLTKRELSPITFWDWTVVPSYTPVSRAELKKNQPILES